MRVGITPSSLAQASWSNRGVLIATLSSLYTQREEAGLFDKDQRQTHDFTRPSGHAVMIHPVVQHFCLIPTPSFHFLYTSNLVPCLSSYLSQYSRQ